MKKTILLLFIGSLLQAQTVTIALAANVSYAMKELQEAFYKENKKSRLSIVIGSSGKLKAQIENNAPYDIFISANMKYPEVLYKKEIATTKPVVYAKGALAIITRKKRDLSCGIKIVAKEDIKRVAIANPQTAPYGKAAKEALQNANLYKKIKTKLVYGESIAQTVTYAITATDLGFIAKSALFSKKMQQFKKGENWVEVEKKLYTPIEQGIVMLKHAKKNSDAKRFYDFILSPKAKAIFKKYGYSVL